MLELALRPASSAQARKPPTARESREAGSGGHWLRLWGRSITSGASSAACRSFASTPNRSQGLTLFLSCDPNRGTEG